MPAIRKPKRHSADEYLLLEEKSEGRNEYDDGLIVAMSGGTINHARIIVNIDRSLSAKLNRECESFTSEVKIRIEDYRRFFYPDVFVICGDPVFYQKRNDTILNPVLVVEVLYDSTEARDRGEKLLAYRTLGSLREYVLVSQRNAVVEQYIRTESGAWIHKATIGLKSQVRLESVNVELSLEEIYRRVEFDEEQL